MANRRMEFMIGMTVVVIFVAVTVMTILFGAQRGLFVHRGGKRMTIVFEKANGITNNSKVVKSGIEIGRVFSRDLKDNGSKTEVHVNFELYPESQLFSNEYARINRNLLGDAAIEFVKNPSFQGDIREIAAKEIIIGKPGGDIMSTVNNIEGDLAKTLQTVTNAAAGLSLFMDNLNSFLGSPDELMKKKDKLQTIFTELNQTLISIKSLVTNLDAMASDPELKDGLRKGAKEIPNILGKVDSLMANANNLTNDFRLTIDRSHRTFEQLEKNLDNIGTFTESLADHGPDFVTSLSESSKDIQKMVQNIGDLAQELSDDFNNPNTAFGMLSDPEVAKSLRGIVDHSEQITLKMQPIMDDARVFTNKIAHKPSTLLWGKESYKGQPASTGQYNFQSQSPNGGLSSSLYDAKIIGKGGLTNVSYTPGGIDPDYMSPDSLDAYYNRYPDKAPKSKSNCSTSKFKFNLFKQTKEPELDLQNRYGTSIPYETQGDLSHLENISPEMNSIMYSAQPFDSHNLPNMTDTPNASGMQNGMQNRQMPSTMNSSDGSTTYMNESMGEPNGMYDMNDPGMQYADSAVPSNDSPNTTAKAEHAGKMKFSLLKPFGKMFGKKEAVPANQYNTATGQPAYTESQPLPIGGGSNWTYDNAAQSGVINNTMTEESIVASHPQATESTTTQMESLPVSVNRPVSQRNFVDDGLPAQYVPMK